MQNKDPIKSIKTTSMEAVNTGALDNRKMVWCIKTYTIAYVKIQKFFEDILSIMSKPNCCLKVDFQKVDQHAGGKWLIYDTKHSKDNQLQCLKLSCRISKLSS